MAEDGEHQGQLQRTFEATNALSNMYLWLLFGFLSTLVNCDLQRLLRSSRLVLHLTSIIAFFFLFTLIDSDNNASLLTTWSKTLVVYVLFLLTTKSKWYFAVPVLGLLLLDQSIKKHVQYKVAQGDAGDETHLWERAGRWINYATYALIFVGALHYMVLQKREYGDDFSFGKFIFGSGQPCKAKAAAGSAR